MVEPIRFPGVDVVEASAGSGKTYALAKRYIQLVMDPQLTPGKELLKSILAVTFTNKATIEMKERILEFLKKIALDRFEDPRKKEDILSSLAIGEDVARRTARNVMDDIVSDYSVFQVQTIDSFMNALLSAFTFHLGSASNLVMREDYGAYMEYSVDALIDRMDEDKDIRKTFDGFLKSYLSVESKQGWLSKKDILDLVKSLYNYRNTFGGTFSKIGIEADDLLKKKQAVIGLAKKILAKAPEETHGALKKSLESFVEKHGDSFYISKLPASFKREEFRVKKDGVVPEAIAEMWTDIRKNLGEICEAEARVLFNPYIDIFNRALSEFEDRADKDAAIFLQELNNRAQSVTGNGQAIVPEICYRLATRLYHYLIDEFQDTSRLQWRNMSPMVHEALSSGGSLFYVGDKKQAIFRFRGGDVLLFDSVQDEFGDFTPQQTALGMNHRSQKEIVQFNNEIFSEDNLRQFTGKLETLQKDDFQFSEADVKKVLGIFDRSKQDWEEENVHGYVKIEPINAGSVDETNSIMQEKLISLVKDLRNRFKSGDIAILARTNRDVELFTSWLIREEIPVESEKTLNIRAHPLIRELVSFLKFLTSPIDNLSFASFISGDIFQKATGTTGETIQEFLFGLRDAGQAQRHTYLYRRFRKGFTEVWGSFMEEFFQNVGFFPLYELIISIFGKFKVVENFPGSQGFFMKFLEVIKENEENYAGISSFLEFFENVEEGKLFVRVTHAESVKIMTIHKAKGLEFPIVIVPFLEMKVGIGSGGPGPRKSYVVRQSGDNNLSLVQLKKEYVHYSQRLAEEYRDEYIKSLIDELDNLYVALTRARYEMYLFIPSKADSAKNIARLLIPFETPERGEKRQYKELPGRDERPLKKLSVSQYSDWIDILKDEFIERSQLVNRDKVLRGEVLHCALSCIGNLHTDDKELCLDTARQKVRTEFPYIGSTDEYISVVKNLVEDEKFKSFFYVEEGKVYQERELVDSSGNAIRIDRLIITPAEAWVIDYKSSKDESGDQEKQIAEYIDIVKSIYPGIKIRGFLIYLDTLSLEEFAPSPPEGEG